jgi:DNA excision repair protein ERCC-2
MADVFGKHSLFDVTLHTASSGSRLCLRNVLPAPFLAPRFAASHSSTLFSATLSPWDYYTDLLGMPETTACVEVASPFAAEQLQVKVMRQMSTRYAHRSRSLTPMARLMAEQYIAQPGNYLAFFSSFDYLQQALALFQAEHPAVPVWQQTPRMDEAGRQAFLARFSEGGQGIGFAVLGGLFGEGIDLPGKQLIGAFIATLGLPQVNPVNEQIMQRMDEIFGDGYSYTYLYPGLRKVVQAAGRVIRTTTDEGVIYLMDDRFARPEVRPLLPSWWQVEIKD